ncbi:MAG: hypothetical protein AAGF01_33095, partial [Cyanobacteria bacterium P01_G01_bin.38]
AMFLTNVFLMPYMAIRLGQVSESQGEKGILATVFGGMGLTVGAIALYWFYAALPEFGTLSDRFACLGQQVMTNRVTLAFCVDLFLFGIFQAVLMGAIVPQGHSLRWLRFVPFFGLAMWLIYPSDVNKN